MRQTEQENDSFEPAFDGSNPILRTIESAQTIEALLNVILEPNALESAILSGISVVLTLIKPLTFTWVIANTTSNLYIITYLFIFRFVSYEPTSDRQRLLQKREREFHQEIQETVIVVMAPRLHEFVHLLKNPPAVRVQRFNENSSIMYPIPLSETATGDHSSDSYSSIWQNAPTGLSCIHRSARDQTRDHSTGVSCS